MKNLSITPRELDLQTVEDNIHGNEERLTLATNLLLWAQHENSWFTFSYKEYLAKFPDRQGQLEGETILHMVAEGFLEVDGQEDWEGLIFSFTQKMIDECYLKQKV